MKITNIIIFFIIALCVLFTIFQINGREFLSSGSKSLIAPLFTALYFLNVTQRSRYFSLFLILFSIAEISTVFEYFTIDWSQEYLDAYYIIGNSVYILAYFFLILEVLKTINLRKVLKSYFIHVIVLLALNIYIVYVLITIVNPKFQVDSEYLIGVELVYNIIMLLLLTLALISYFYNDNRKTLLLFFGSICIVFSEVIQIAYFYIADQDLLNIAQTILFVLAFSFFYFQSKVKNKKVHFFA